MAIIAGRPRNDFVKYMYNPSSAVVISAKIIEKELILELRKVLKIIFKKHYNEQYIRNKTKYCNIFFYYLIININCLN